MSTSPATSAHPRTAPPDDPIRPAPGESTSTLGVWRTVIFLALAVATLFLSIVAAGRGAVPGDRAVARWLQANPIPYGDPVAIAFNEGIGGHSLTVAALLMAGALLVARRRQAAVLIAAAAGLR